MITKSYVDKVLPMVADSWQQLRKADVYRLLDQLHEEYPDQLHEAGKIIKQQRPDLKHEVEDCLEELWFEYEAPIQYHD